MLTRNDIGQKMYFYMSFVYDSMDNWISPIVCASVKPLFFILRIQLIFEPLND
jgi:hypothetical protein